MNLYEKIVEVKKEIEFFKKDTKGYNYSYVSGSQVLAKVKNKMDTLGLLLVPSIDHSNSNYQIFQYDTVDRYQKQKHVIEYIVTAPMTYTWINAEAPTEKLEIPWSLYGQQEDISKSLGSALTYSERYFLMKFFNVPTDDLDPDTKQEYLGEVTKLDIKTDVVKKAKENAAKAKAAAQEAQEQLLNSEKISPMQIKTLLMLSNNDVELCKTVIKKYGYEKSSDICHKDYAAIHGDIKDAMIKRGVV